MGKKIVVAPEEAEDSNSCKRRFGKRHNHLEEDLVGIAAFHKRRFLKIDRQASYVSRKHHDGKCHISCDLGKDYG